MDDSYGLRPDLVVAKWNKLWLISQPVPFALQDGALCPYLCPYLCRTALEIGIWNKVTAMAVFSHRK